MGIGFGITLLVLGAIAYFTNLDSNLLNTNLNTVGLILMAGGVLALILGLIQNGQRQRSTTRTVVERPDVHETEIHRDGSVSERHVERDDRV